MKIRLQFVSNSSSSSFIAVGIQCSSDRWKEVLEKFGIVFYDDDEESFVKVDGFTLIKGNDDNGIKSDKMMIATDFIKGDSECNYIPDKIVEISKVKEKLLSKGFEGEISVKLGTMLT